MKKQALACLPTRMQQPALNPPLTKPTARPKKLWLPPSAHSRLLTKSTSAPCACSSVPATSNKAVYLLPSSSQGGGDSRIPQNWQYGSPINSSTPASPNNKSRIFCQSRRKPDTNSLHSCS